MVAVKFFQMFAGVFLHIYELLFVVRVFISWIPISRGNKLFELIYAATEPVLAPIRALLYKIPGVSGLPIDFSVLVAYIIIDVLRMFLT